MALYHINSATGETGACRAQQGRCPFGSADAHYFSQEAARHAYEKTQGGAVSPPVRKAAPILAPTSHATFAKAVAAHFPKKSKLITPPKHDDNEGYLGGRRFAGGKTGTSYISQKAAAAGVRKDVAEARKAGEIPEWLSVSVTANSGSGVSSLSVSIGRKVDGKMRAIPLEWLESKSGHSTEASIKVQDYIGRLARQYETSDINGQVDYFSTFNHPHVTFRRSWDDTEADKRS